MARATRMRVIVCRSAGLVVLLLGASAGWTAGAPQTATAGASVPADTPIQLADKAEVAKRLAALKAG